MSETALTKPLPQTPLAMVQLALEKNADPANLERLLALQERYDAARAFEAFAADMNAVQKRMPTVLKDKENSHTKSSYASLEAVNEIVKPIYSEHGFSISFGTEQSNVAEHIRVVADVCHVGGYQKRYFGDFALDGAGLKGGGNKTPIQAAGSTISYARRYLTLMIFNVSVADEDDDGQGYVEAVSVEDLRKITGLMNECKENGNPVDMERFLAWVGTIMGRVPESLADNIPATAMPKIIDFLNRKRMKGGAA